MSLNATQGGLSSSSFPTSSQLAFTWSPDEVGFESSQIAGEGRIMYDITSSSINYTYQHYLKDHLGSTRMVINDQGAVTEAIMYQPYGTMSDPLNISTPDIAAREKFTGKEYDQEGLVAGVTDGLKLDYFGARYYDPEIGVWTSTDPAEQFWNSYSYTGGNPINGVDPDGSTVYSDDFVGPLQSGDVYASQVGMSADYFQEDISITADASSSVSQAIVDLASYGLNAAGERMMGLSATLFAGSMAGYGIAAIPTPASPEIAGYSTFALSASGYAGIVGSLLIGTSQILQQQYIEAIATGLLTASGKPVGKMFEALGASKGLSGASDWITEQYFETQRVRK